jgi:hypothetical protein
MKVGDRICCVSDEMRVGSLVKYKIYTINYIFELTECLAVLELPNCTYAMSRFITERELRRMKLKRLENV